MFLTAFEQQSFRLRFRLSRLRTTDVRFPPGPRPPYSKVADHLWGSGCNFDSDGNSDHPETTDWTELTVTLRAPPWQQGVGTDERVDVDPLGGGEPLVLAIVSESDDLARREAGGELTFG